MQPQVLLLHMKGLTIQLLLPLQSLLLLACKQDRQYSAHNIVMMATTYPCNDTQVQQG